MSYGDAVRALGCLAVVGLHLALQVSEHPSELDATWWFYTLVDGATRWAVPAFVMLSGALLLKAPAGETDAEFYRKRLRRLAPAVLFWPAFYLLWRAHVLGEPLTLRGGLKSLLLGEPFHHLHFLFALPGLYFLTPMLRVYVRHASPSQSRLLAVSVVVLTVLSGAIQELRGVDFALGHNALTRFLPFLGFFLAGYALREVVLTRRGLVLAGAGFGASVVLFAAGTYVLMRAYPGMGMYFFTQYSITRFVGGTCVFCILATVCRDGVRPAWLNDCIRVWLAPASLGVYLVHPIFIELGARAGLSIEWPNRWVGLPLTWLLVWLASLAATLLLRRVPYVARLFG